MLNKIQALVLALLMLALGCSGGSSGFRTYGEDTSADPNGSSVADTSNRPRDEGVSPDDYTTGAIPNPISGSNLVAVLVSATCVSTQGASVQTCNEVRLIAKVKVNDAEPVRFGADILKPLGVRSYAWEFRDLPSNTTCQSSGGGLDFNPLCTSSSGSLAEAKIKATLSLEASDGTVFKGDSPNTNPGTGVVYGNFMLVDAIVGLTPSGKLYPGANELFVEIWQDLVSGVYLTNKLYSEASVTTTWNESQSLCENVDSGDGAGKWHIPSGKEICGSNFNESGESNTCSAGLFGHGIVNVPVRGIHSSSWGFVWSSSSRSVDLAWYVNVASGYAGYSDKIETGPGAFCVR